MKTIGSILITISVLLIFPGSVLANTPWSFTQEAWHIRGSTATLTGMATPRSNSATAVFQYRAFTPGCWGELCPAAWTTTNPPQAMSATVTPIDTTGNVVRITKSISGLSPGVTYEYRLVTSSSFGTTKGQSRLFSTGKPVIVLGTVHSSGSAQPSSDIMRNVATFGTGMDTAYVISTTGQLYPWGKNHYGQLNIPPATQALMASGGQDHTIALSPTGIPLAWGYSTAAQATVPSSLRNPDPETNITVSILAGRMHNILLRAFGTVLCFGSNMQNQRTVPSDAQKNMVAVAAAIGGYHNLALRNDGTVWAWGLNNSEQINIPGGLSGVIALAAGGNHSLALKDNGAVVAWGANDSGQAVVPSSINQAAAQGSGYNKVIAIAAGGAHSLALRQDGSVIAWGAHSIPGQLNQAVAIAAGGSYSMVMSDFNLPPTATRQTLDIASATYDNVIKLLGSDPNGDPLTFKITRLPQKGRLYQVNDSGARIEPAISAANTVVSNAAGHIIFVADPEGEGEPYTSFDIAVTDRPTVPTPVYSSSQTVELKIKRYDVAFTRYPSNITATGATFRAAVYPNGFQSQVWFEWGEKGRYANSSPTQPLTLSGSNKMFEFRAREDRLETGKLYQVRLVLRIKNAIGEWEEHRGWPRLFTTAGHAYEWGLTAGSIPPPLPGPGNLVAIGGSEQGYYLGINNSGYLVAWGNATWGQLPIPTALVEVLRYPLSFDSSVYNSGAISQAGRPYLWGDPNASLPGPQIDDAVEIALGEFSALVLRADGTVLGWGTKTSSGTPGTQVPEGLKNVVQISARGDWSLALRYDGSLTLWGSGNPLINLPTTIGDVIAILQSNRAGVALKSNGTVAGWGGSYYQPPTGADGIVAISSSKSGGQQLALKEDGSLFSWGYNGRYLTPQDSSPPIFRKNIAQTRLSGLTATVLLSNISPPEAPMIPAAPRNLRVE